MIVPTLIDEGRIVAADKRSDLQEKHDSNYPFNAVEFVLKESNYKLNDIDYIVFENHFSNLKDCLKLTWLLHQEI